MDSSCLVVVAGLLSVDADNKIKKILSLECPRLSNLAHYFMDNLWLSVAVGLLAADADVDRNINFLLRCLSSRILI